MNDGINLNDGINHYFPSIFITTTTKPSSPRYMLRWWFITYNRL